MVFPLTSLYTVGTTLIKYWYMPLGASCVHCTPSSGFTTPGKYSPNASLLIL
uniref:Endoplasmic reticulum-Golgi intermediate compartment protein n=1 Tax=Rhizophora mucronata TaxID=61149 RepID=A0A2P2M8F7_RHIMU